jgi:excisionase family DNA binding protein
MPPKETQLLKHASAAPVGQKPQLRQEPAQHYSIPFIAGRLSITDKGLRGILARREMESVKVGRLRRITADAVKRYLARNNIPAID